MRRPLPTDCGECASTQLTLVHDNGHLRFKAGSTESAHTSTSSPSSGAFIWGEHEIPCLPLNRVRRTTQCCCLRTKSREVKLSSTPFASYL